MSEPFRRSKLHRHGIVLKGDFDKDKLYKFIDAHPKRNVLYIAKNAKLPRERVNLQDKIKNIWLKRSCKITASDVENTFKWGKSTVETVDEV